MRQRVELWIRSTDVSSFGEHSESFDVTATRWASVEPLSGKEFYAKVGETSEMTTIFRLRYDSVTAAMTTYDRFKYNGKQYDIKSVTNTDERSRELIFVAVENDRQS